MSTIKKMFSFILSKLKSLFQQFSRFLVPGLLIILVILPIWITYFAPSSVQVEAFSEPIQLSTGDIYKKLKSTAKIELEYSYDLKVYQTAEIVDLMVKEGDFVKEGQVLATLKYTSENKTRATDLLTQIQSYQTDISNSLQSKQITSEINNSTEEQLDVKQKNIEEQIRETQQKISDKIKEESDKKEKYIAQKAEYEKLYNQLNDSKNISDAIKTYQDRIDAIKSGNLSTSLSSIQVSINSQKASVLNYQSLVSSSCDTTNPSYNATTCSQNQTQLKLAQDNLTELQNQYNITNRNESISNNNNSQEISDLEYKIKELKKNPAYSNVKRFPPITDSAYTAQIESQKSDYKSKITNLENDLKTLENSQEVKNLQDTLNTYVRNMSENDSNSKLQKDNLDSNLSSVDQKIASSSTSIEGLKMKLKDTQEDIKNQEENRVLKAKKDGVVAYINKDKNLILGSGDTQFTIISENYRLKIPISAESFAKIQTENKVTINNSDFASLKDLKVNRLALSSNQSTGTSTNDSAEYNVEVDLPNIEGVKYIAGRSVEVEITVAESQNTKFLPRTSVVGNKVYVGLNPVLDAQNPNSDKPTFKFSSFKELEIKTGIDNGREIEVLDGVLDSDYIFKIFPKSDSDKASIEKDYKSIK